MGTKACTIRILSVVAMVALVALGVTACGRADESAPSAGNSSSVSAQSPSASTPPPTAAPTPPTSEPSTTSSPSAPTIATDESTPGDDRPDSDTAPATTEPDAVEPTGGSGESSAAEALGTFFAAAEASDRNLADAAVAINSGINGDVLIVEQATVDQLHAGQPTAVAAAIPGGLDPAVEQAALLVYSDLSSRYMSMDNECVWQAGTFMISELPADCFVWGHAAAVRTAADIEAARAAAAGSYFTAASPDSRAVADVALRVLFIGTHNGGCGGTGGYIATERIPIDWNAEPSGDPGLASLDGHVGGAGFRANYSVDTGWTVDINAC